MTPKNIHKIFIPQKILIFLKTQKNIEIQNFEPQKMTRAYVMYENIRVPPLGVDAGPKPMYAEKMRVPPWARFKPATPQSQVKLSTTEQPRSY